MFVAVFGEGENLLLKHRF